MLRLTTVCAVAALAPLLAGCRPAETPTVGNSAAVEPKRDPWLAQKARETQGDYFKLDAADRAKLDAQTHGNGARALMQAYRDQGGGG
jgi:hypothetical protein